MAVGQYGPEVILNGNVLSPIVMALTSITVKNPDLTAATLYTDTTGSTTLGTNVVTTDTRGQITFFAAAGPYKLVYTDSIGSQTLTVIVYEDAADLSATFAPYNVTNARNPLTGWFHIDQFGATLAGAATNRAKIQEAADAAYAAGGGIVYVPDLGASFPVDGWTGASSNVPAFYGIRLKSGVTLKGAGIGLHGLSAVSVPGAGGQGAFIGNDQTLGLTDIGVEDLTIDLGQGSQTSNAAAIMFGNPYAAGVGVTRPTVKNCTTKNVPFLGIQLRDGCTDFIIDNNRVRNVFYIGIQVQNSAKGSINNNNVAVCTDNAIDISGDIGAGVESAAHHITVTGNVLRNSKSGVFLETTANCQVIGNTIDAVQYGVYVNRISSFTHHNAIVGNTITNFTVRGVEVNNNVFETTITGNPISVPAGLVGILVNTAYRGSICGNPITGTDGALTATGIRFAGGSAGFAVTGNSFNDLAKDVELTGGSFSITTVGNHPGNTTTPRGSVIGTGSTDKIAAYGSPAIVRPNGTPAIATDLATTLTLVNYLRQSLLDLGWIE